MASFINKTFYLLNDQVYVRIRKDHLEKGEF
jgi:hypothetical protein